jgi:hypothetical protein
LQALEMILSRWLVSFGRSKSAWQYFVWLVNLVSMWDSKAVVLVQHYSLYVYLLLLVNPIFPEGFGERNWQMVEC